MKKENNKKPILNNIDDELMDLIEEASEVSGISETSVSSISVKEEKELYFELKDTDNEFLRALKIAINNSGITNQEVYTKKGQRNGYNMIYSLDHKSQLGIERIKEWCLLIHKKVTINFVDMTDEEIKEAEELLNK